MSGSGKGKGKWEKPVGIDGCVSGVDQRHSKEINIGVNVNK